MKPWEKILHLTLNANSYIKNVHSDNMHRNYIGSMKDLTFILGYNFRIPHYTHADIKQKANIQTAEQFE